MFYTMSTKGTTLTEGLKDAVRAELERLNKYFADTKGVVAIDVFMRVEKERHICEITLRTGKEILRAERESADMYQSIADAVDTLEQRYIRSKERFLDRKRQAEAEPVAENHEEDPSAFARVKHFAASTIEPEEAISQMEMVGHDFFVFRNSWTDEINVVYRRAAGGYGLLIPN